MRLGSYEPKKGELGHSQGTVLYGFANDYKEELQQSIFVIFIKLYLSIFVSMHTCAQDYMACESYRIPGSWWQAYTHPS